MKAEKSNRRTAETPPVSEETRRWSALLESELLSWPGVIAKRMFGFRALYRGKKNLRRAP